MEAIATQDVPKPHARWRNFSRGARLTRWPVLLLIVVMPVVCFAGGQGSIALVLATGIGIEPLQLQVNRLQNKAIRKEQFTTEDRRFLQELYGAMAKGARLSVVLGESGRLMDHYLAATGEPLELEPRIFQMNHRVQQQMNVARARIKTTVSSGAPLQNVYSSPRFYMPHPSSPDSVSGLYWGTVQAFPRIDANGTIRIRWRAEVPWQWPSYDSLRARYGTPHAETFLIPNARALVSGSRYALRIENGLGEQLAVLGLAKAFLAWAQWEEPIGDATGPRSATALGRALGRNPLGTSATQH